MTLSDVHAEPRLLAAYLNVPFEAGTVYRREWYYGRFHCEQPREASAEERVSLAWRAYRRAMEADYRKHHPAQTHGQFLAECLREALGVKAKGKLADRLDYARLSRPDLYQPPAAA
jgi:hypothetical protein